MTCKPAIVITGIASATPYGFEHATTVEKIWRGECAFSTLAGEEFRQSSVAHGGQCVIPPDTFLPNKKVFKLLAKKDLLALTTLLRTQQDAHLSVSDYEATRTGLYIGAGCNEPGDYQPYFLPIAECLDDDGNFANKKFGNHFKQAVNPLFVMKMLFNNSLCYGANFVNAHGNNGNFMEFETSGLKAVGAAFAALQDNRLDVAYAGGIAPRIEPFYVVSAYQQGWLAPTAHGMETMDKRKVVRPFDAWRVGTLPCEGAAFVSMEREADARARGAKIYGKVVGVSNVNASPSFATTSRNGAERLEASLKQVIEKADVDEKQIGCIMSHACGQKAYDADAAAAYLDFLGMHASEVPVCSPKGLYGDMGEASGVFSLILALDCLKQQRTMPTFNFARSEKQFRSLRISADAENFKKPLALITAHSKLGGVMSVAVTS